MRTGGSSAKSGVALILTLLSLALMAVLSLEIIAASRVEIKIGTNLRDRLQAYYLAQSAARFSILRLYLYKEAKNLMGTSQIPIPGVNAQLIDGIWSFPLPSLPVAGMDKIIWPGKISASVSGEGSKIPINLMDANQASNSQAELVQAASVRSQVRNLVEGLMLTDDFDKLYHGIKSMDLLEPLVQWLGGDMGQDQGQTGQDYESQYESLTPPYKERKARIPTLTEVHMMANWNDDLYDRIAKNFSVLSNKTTINPNYLSGDRLRAFGPHLSDDDIAYIIKRRMEQPFTDLQNLASFVQTDPGVKGGRDFVIPKDLQPSTQESIFIIEASGIVGEVKRSLRLGVRITDDSPPPGASPSPSPSPAPNGATQGTPNPKLLQPVVVLVEEIL